ncbi:MAG: isoprenyl transferase [Pyrinomonadaceae bacterium]
MLDRFAQVIEPGSAETRLLDEIDTAHLPRHIAIIMDGNGRWAKLRGKPRIFGHKAGAESVRAILDTCARLKIEAVTLYAFSTENWKRPKAEVSGLMSMLKRYIRSEMAEVKANNIRFQAIGNISGLSDSVQKELAWAAAQTAENTGTILSVALNYGGRAEIVEAARRASRQLLDQGKSLERLTEADIERNLYTYGLPEVDLLIRTSGEMRISNFLLWQLAYSEIYVTPTFFPDFRRPHIFEAIIEYQKRDRRFGDVAAQVSNSSR